MGVPYAEVIGDPIAHSKSPLIHEFWLERLGLEGEYRALRVGAGELADYLESRRADPDWRGCNVTMPHKETILDFLDEVSPEAARIGAVNIVERRSAGMVGANSDVAALRDEILGIAQAAVLFDQPVVLIGAGGAARAALQVLCTVQDVEVWILNRSVPKAQTLLAQFGLRGRAMPIETRLPATWLLINASCLGMKGCPALEVDPADAGKPVVVDLVYAPAQTDLLRHARERGMATIDGITMLIGQAAIAFRLFFRVAPPTGTEEELRGLLTS